jgi:hypothetical protein
MKLRIRIRPSPMPFAPTRRLINRAKTIKRVVGWFAAKPQERKRPAGW